MSDDCLLIISSDHRIPRQSIKFSNDWKIIDLKIHLSKVYPGKPPREGQRLINAGKLVSDDIVLSELFSKDSSSKALHLVVCPSTTDKLESKHTKTDIKKTLTAQELKEYQEKYIAYLNSFYKDASMSNYSQSIWQLECARLQSEYANQQPLQQSQAPIEQPNAIGEPNAPIVGQRNMLNRLVNFMRRDDAAPEIVPALNGDEQPGEGFDFFDFAHTLFRFSLISAICLVYSSWERIIIVAIIAACFYWHNGMRRNRQVVEAVVPNPVVQNVPQNDNENVNAENEIIPNVSTPPMNTNVPEVAPEPVRYSILNIFRMLTVTSFQFFCAIFTSLVPELPINMD